MWVCTPGDELPALPLYHHPHCFGILTKYEEAPSDSFVFFPEMHFLFLHCILNSRFKLKSKPSLACTQIFLTSPQLQSARLRRPKAILRLTLKLHSPKYINDQHYYHRPVLLQHHPKKIAAAVQVIKTARFLACHG
jgi:hypothetical protein